MTQPLDLLLVDPDPSGLEILTFGFEREGAKVDATADVLGAPKRLAGTSPSLLVVAVRGGDPAAFEVIRWTRSGRSTPGISVLAIGAAEQREAAMAAGASEFVATPAFIRDVINGCKLA